MPILGFEKHRHRKYLTRAFQQANIAAYLTRTRDNSLDSKARVLSRPQGELNGASNLAGSSDDEESASEGGTSRLYPPDARAWKSAREARLLSGYLDSKRVKPAHCRRTLDQFSYYMLNSTEARDQSQVAYRWAKNVSTEAKNRPIVMVDQLWLWAFQDGSVVTSFPNTWSGQEDFNLSNVIVKELRYNKDRPIIKSMEDLLHLILQTSLDFFKRIGPAGFQFHEGFQSSINNVSEQEQHLSLTFRRLTKKLSFGMLSHVERKREIEYIFQRLDEETTLIAEIRDIQDELTTVKTVLGQQQLVLERLRRLYPKGLDDADVGGEDDQAQPGQLFKDQASRSVPGEKPTVALGGDQRLQTEDPESTEYRRTRVKGNEEGWGSGRLSPTTNTAAVPTEANLLQNRDLMYETMRIVENNIRIVQSMLEYAKKVESSVRSAVY